MLSNFRFAYQINFAHMQIFLKVIDNSQKKDYDNTKEFDKSISLKWGVVMETIPKYREIMDYIQEQIQNHVYQQNAKLPTEQELSEQFDVSDTRTLDEVVRWLMEMDYTKAIQPPPNRAPTSFPSSSPLPNTGIRRV